MHWTWMGMILYRCNKEFWPGMKIFPVVIFPRWILRPKVLNYDPNPMKIDPQYNLNLLSNFFHIFFRFTCLHVLAVGRKKWNISMSIFLIDILSLQICNSYFIRSLLSANNSSIVWYLCFKDNVLKKILVYLLTR